MTIAARRILMIGLMAFLQFQPFTYGKAPKKTEVEGLVYATFPGQPGPSKTLMDLLVFQARFDDGNLGDKSDQRIRLRFEKIDEQANPAATPARYRVFAVGAPENKVYEWRIWHAGQNSETAPDDIYVNARGLLLTHRPSPEEEYSLQAPGNEFYLAPEADSAVPLRYAVLSRDNQLVIPGTLVPQPVAAQDHGCRLEVRIAEPNASAVLLVADGFPLESKIPLVLESEGENANLTMVTDSGGHSIVAGFPHIAGKTKGILRATAEGPDCLPSVSLPWKEEAPSTPKTP
jgi:hypothetical protein